MKSKTTAGWDEASSAARPHGESEAEDDSDDSDDEDDNKGKAYVYDVVGTVAFLAPEATVTTRRRGRRGPRGRGSGGGGDGDGRQVGTSASVCSSGSSSSSKKSLRGRCGGWTTAYDPYAADLYAFGLTLLSLLCGSETPPFLRDGPTTAEQAPSSSAREAKEQTPPRDDSCCAAIGATRSTAEVLSLIRSFGRDVAPTLRDAKTFVERCAEWESKAVVIGSNAGIKETATTATAAAATACAMTPQSLHYWCPLISSLVSPLPLRCTSIPTLLSSLVPRVILGTCPLLAVESLFNASACLVTFDPSLLPTLSECRAAANFLKGIERRGTAVHVRVAAGRRDDDQDQDQDKKTGTTLLQDDVADVRAKSGAGATVVVISRPFRPGDSSSYSSSYSSSSSSVSLDTPDAVLQYIPSSDFISREDSVCAAAPLSPPTSCDEGGDGRCVFLSFSSLAFAFEALRPPLVHFRDYVSVRQDKAMVDGLGGVVWDGAHALLSFLADNICFTGKTVLELGAGCGIAGLLCHRLGASRVIITDGEVDLIEDNVDLYASQNQLDGLFPLGRDGVLEIKKLKWNAGEPLNERLDYVIGSELTPMRTQHKALAGEFHRLLDKSGGGVGILELDIDSENEDAIKPFVDVTGDFEAELDDARGHSKLLSGGGIGFLREALKLGLKWKLVSIQEVLLEGGGIQGRDGHKSCFGIIYLAVINIPLAVAAAAATSLRAPPPASSGTLFPAAMSTSCTPPILGHPPATSAFARFLVSDFLPLLRQQPVKKIVDVGGSPALLSSELRTMNYDVTVTVVDPRPCNSLVPPDVHLPVFFSSSLFDCTTTSSDSSARTNFSYADALRLGLESLSFDLKGGRLRPAVAVASDDVAPWRAPVDNARASEEAQPDCGACLCGCRAECKREEAWGLSALMGAGALVGVHPDNAAGMIVECGLRHGVPFAVVPCCVFESENTDRKNISGPRTGETVATYDELIEWMVDLGRVRGEEVFVRQLHDVKGGKNLAVCFLGKGVKGSAKAAPENDPGVSDPFWDIALSPATSDGLALRNLVPDYEDFNAQQEEEGRKLALRRRGREDASSSSDDDDDDDDGFPMCGSAARRTSRKTFKTFKIFSGKICVDLHQLQEDGVLSTIGGEVWEAAYLLSNYLCLRKDVVVKSEKVLELGAGLGLVGLVCASLFDEQHKKGRVCLSDFSFDLVRNLKRNARRNRVGGMKMGCEVNVRKIDWFDYTQQRQSRAVVVAAAAAAVDEDDEDDDAYDLLVGSALVYSPSHAALADALKYLLGKKRGSKALVLQILDRPGFRDAFLPRCEELGLDVKIEAVTEEVVKLAEESMGKKLSDPRAFGVCTISCKN